MATDATGTPTALGIPKYNPDADAPSGLGFNAAMDAIDPLITDRAKKPSGILSGEVPVWNGTTWVRSSVTKIGAASLPDPAMVLLYNNTLGADTATLDSGTLPTTQTWTHLLIQATVQGTLSAVSTAASIRFNGDTGNTYGYQWVRGSAAAASAGSTTSVSAIYLGEVPAATTGGNFFAPLIIRVNNATGGHNKYGLIDSGSFDASASWRHMIVGQWASTAAITSVQIFPTSGNWKVGSRLTVYGMI